MKMASINRNWSLMFSGDASSMVPVVESVREDVRKLRLSNLRSFALACSRSYRRARQPVIETEILSEFDIETYADYCKLKKSDPDGYLSIREEITKMEEGWSLLFHGFDRYRCPHIFVIAERGKIQYCDMQSFAAIGSGGLRALISLSSYPFKRTLPFSEAIFALLSAKFASESADGVGKETLITILEPEQENAGLMSNFTLETMRWMWNTLPRFHPDATAEIWKDLTRLKRLGLYAREVESPTPEELRRHELTIAHAGAKKPEGKVK